MDLHVTRVRTQYVIGDNCTHRVCDQQDVVTPEAAQHLKEIRTNHVFHRPISMLLTDATGGIVNLEILEVPTHNGIGNRTVVHRQIVVEQDLVENFLYEPKRLSPEPGRFRRGLPARRHVRLVQEQWVIFVLERWIMWDRVQSVRPIHEFEPECMLGKTMLP